MNLLTAGVNQVYWLNMNQKNKRNILELRSAFEAIMPEGRMQVTIVFDQNEESMALSTRDWLKQTGAKVVNEGISVEDVYAGVEGQA